jgi:hypothetical protein
MNVPPTTAFVLACMSATFDAREMARDAAAKATLAGRAAT